MNDKNLLITLSFVALALLSLPWLPSSLQVSYYFIKPLPVGLMMLNLWPKRHQSYPRFVLWAFFFSLLGDILLMFKPTPLFIAGMITFMLAHIFYVRAFIPNYRWQKWHGAVLVVLLVYGAGVFTWMAPSLGKLLMPVAVYVFLILSMGFLAITSQRPYTTLGAILFMISDTSLATNKFVTPIPMAGVVILGTYYLSQLSFLFSAKCAED